jgi:hypothetical protein
MQMYVKESVIFENESVNSWLLFTTMAGPRARIAEVRRFVIHHECQQRAFGR